MICFSNFAIESNHIVYRAVMAVGVGILYNSCDFAILYFVLLAINVCLMLYPQSLRLSW